ncbi:RCC1/BLIP-II [Annulohypoxylon nitens]|nr:RCC1/BLIP-II [Annulohypoxylon nitens]
MPPRVRKAATGPTDPKPAAAATKPAKAAATKSSRANKVTKPAAAPKRENGVNGRAKGSKSESQNSESSGTSKASSKRKREEDEDENEESEDVPKTKKSKTAPAGETKAKPATKSSRAKATTATKATKSAKPVANTKKPRAPRTKAKAEEDQVGEQVEEDEEPESVPPAKKSRTAKPAAEPKPAKPATRTRGLGAKGVAINTVPSKPFDVFVFGEGSSGELGLGSKKFEGKKPIDVKRPRINHNLKGVVDIACGGMHCIALTNEQIVLTWGVNDDRALGRDTHWEGGTRDVDDESDSDDDDSDDTGVNPNESTPGRVDLSVLPEGTKIAQVAATDSASFILTDDGWVYGWGTFRGSDGIIGFSDGVRTQATPTIIPGLKSISRLACGSNHVLALDQTGKVFTWGSGGQFQLGRKPLSRLGGPSAGLTPQPCGKFSKKHRATQVGAGSYHSFYIDDNEHVWAWGLNNYAQTGLNDDTGEDDAMVLQPQIVKSLEDQKVSQIVGGEHHSVACTADGKLLTWGRVDGHQVGQPASIYTEDNALFDSNNKPRILLTPTLIDGIKTTYVAAGTDTSFAIDEAGKVYSWGFSANYQTGQGTIDDIEVPTVIDNSAIRDRKIIWAGAGGQYSVVAAAANDNLPNGH